MSKKKDKKPKDDVEEIIDADVLARLTKEDYLEWSNELTLMQKAQKSVQVADLELHKYLLESKLKQIDLRNGIKREAEEYNRCKLEYENIKKKIEKKYNIELKDCTVNPFSYEVKKIEP